MMRHSKLKLFLLYAVVVLCAVGCGGAINASIGGTLSGLSGNDTVGLVDNGTDPISLSANGNFTFPTQIAAGSTFDVTVSTQPIGETCSVANGVGTIEQSSGDVSDVTVSCAVTLTSGNYISGTISGLAAGGTVTLLNNGTNSLPVSTNGGFSFPTAIAAGAPYSVVISGQPSGQTCVIVPSTASGVVPATGSAPLVTITCS
jgi:hypothetical protein